MTSRGDSVCFSAPASTTMKASEQNQDIVEKLHGALASLRRERDEEHRKRELAMERLRLAKEEREAMEKTLASMKDNLSKILKTTNEETNDEIVKLQQDVERLTLEANVQHQELLRKREKLAQFQAAIDASDRERKNSLARASNTVRKRREKAVTVKAELSEEAKMRSMKILLNDTPSLVHSPDWPKVMEQKAAELLMKACDTHRKNEALMKKIHGYRRHLSTGTESAIRDTD